MVDEAKSVPEPDDMLEVWLKTEDDIEVPLTLLAVLVVDLTEELGERFLLLAEGGAERGHGWLDCGFDGTVW